MAYELLNSAQVTPVRLYALVRLVDRLKCPKREELLNLLQPAVLFTSKGDQADLTASTNIYLAAKHCNLIEESAEGILQVQEDVKPYLNTLERFRTLMQQRVWNVKYPEQNNYLFNLYCAWYVAQNERVFEFEDKDFETYFNEELFEDAEQRTFNMTKFNGWRTWAVFLGLGRSMRPGIISSKIKETSTTDSNDHRARFREILVPDANHRLRGILPLLFAQSREKTVRFSALMQELSQFCPELDGGILFQQCQEARHNSEQRVSYLSLALSTGLRQLHYSGFVQLIREADSTETWHLYPAEGHDLNLKEVTHIQFLEQNNYGQ